MKEEKTENVKKTKSIDEKRNNSIAKAAANEVIFRKHLEIINMLANNGEEDFIRLRNDLIPLDKETQKEVLFHLAPETFY